MFGVLRSTFMAARGVEARGSMRLHRLSNPAMLATIPPVIARADKTSPIIAQILPVFTLPTRSGGLPTCCSIVSTPCACTSTMIPSTSPTDEWTTTDAQDNAQNAHELHVAGF